jgi:membrane-bound ClpP family serine protease
MAGFIASLAASIASLAMAQVEIDLGNDASVAVAPGVTVRIAYQGDGERRLVQGVVLSATDDAIELRTEDSKRVRLMRIEYPDGKERVRRWVVSHDIAALSDDLSKKRTIFFLPWRGMVGTGARHEQIDAVGVAADKLGPGQLIVLHVDSPGGLVTEGDEIHESLLALKKRHRVVAWIKKAISAGAYTSLHCDEIYFEKVGNLGAITMFSGTTAISGERLDFWLKKVGDVTETGGRNRWIGEAMVTNAPLLSYDRDEDGNITWYNTLEGEFKLSDEEQNLSLTATTAVHSRFAGGIANTRRELVELLGYRWSEIELSAESDRISAEWEEKLARSGKRLRAALRNYRNPGRIEDAENLGVLRRAVEEVIKVLRDCQPAALEMVVEGHPLWPGEMGPDVGAWEDLLERIKKAIAERREN